LSIHYPYTRFRSEDLTLRDELALDRTVLANERTLLGYVRTALGLLVVGLTFLHFLEKAVYHLAGFAFMAAAIILLIAGTFRFRRMQRQLRQIRETLAGSE